MRLVTQQASSATSSDYFDSDGIGPVYRARGEVAVNRTTAPFTIAGARTGRTRFGVLPLLTLWAETLNIAVILVARKG